MGKEVSRIPERLWTVFADAEATVTPANPVADELAHRIVAGGGDNVVQDAATDGLIASLTNFICSDLSSPVQ